MRRSVDAVFAPGYYPAPRARSTRVIAFVALVAVTLACATTGGPVNGPVSPGIEAEAVRSTALERPLRIRFDWTLRETDARFDGEGVTRVQPPDRARLDLFGPRGESVLSAALVGRELRLPPGAGAGPLPPAQLLWSLLGVFRPPEGAELVTAAPDGGGLLLEYVDGDAWWRYRLAAGRLESAEWNDGAGGRHTVELNGSAAYGVPDRVEYRDHAAFRQLVLSLEQVDEVEQFPADIWTPGAL